MFVADELRPRVRQLDMDARGLDVLTYVQELLARRYEALAIEDKAQRMSSQEAAGSGQ